MDIKIPELTNKNNKEIAKQLAKVLIADKGIDVSLFNVTDTTVITDYYIIATGRSSTHIKSLADDLADKSSEAKYPPTHIEGRDGGEWILLDYGNIIVHIFGKDSRAFYNLERLCSEKIDISDVEAELDRELSQPQKTTTDDSANI